MERKIDKSIQESRLQPDFESVQVKNSHGHNRASGPIWENIVLQSQRAILDKAVPDLGSLKGAGYTKDGIS